MHSSHIFIISLLVQKSDQIVGTQASGNGAKKPFLTPPKPEAAEHTIMSMNLLLTALVNTKPQL